MCLGGQRSAAQRRPPEPAPAAHFSRYRTLWPQHAGGDRLLLPHVLVGHPQGLGQSVDVHAPELREPVRHAILLQPDRRHLGL